MPLRPAERDFVRYYDFENRGVNMQSQTLNISLPKDLVKKVDEVAKKEYRNRSELIREALRIYLIDQEEWKDLSAYGKKIGERMGIKSEEDVNKIVYEFRHGKKTR